MSDAHHEWEERDGASDVGVEHTKEGIPEWSSAAGMTSLDAVNIKTVLNAEHL